MVGIYIHIPFCHRRCRYCDFCSSVSGDERIEEYVKALIKSIESCQYSGISADTVYFGGGTPSLLSAGQMDKILTAVSNKFALTDNCEITTEANPGTVSFGQLKAFHLSGINRISFGIQSCKAKELDVLGRLHTFEEARQAVGFAQDCGIENVSADLMLGIPYQTVDTALESIEKFVGMGIKHLSAYMLKIEPGTAFDSPEIRSILPPDDDVADMYLKAVKDLEIRGFEQYEISNFSLPGYQSKHNIKYWTGEDYLGFGPSAHSYFSGRRFFVPPDIDRFINDPLKPPEIEDEHPNKLEEYIMLGLRMCKGILLDGIDALGGSSKDVLDVCRPFISAGLMRHNDGKIMLTPEGFLVSNGIISKII